MEGAVERGQREGLETARAATHAGRARGSSLGPRVEGVVDPDHVPAWLKLEHARLTITAPTSAQTVAAPAAPTTTTTSPLLSSPVLLGRDALQHEQLAYRHTLRVEVQRASELDLFASTLYGETDCYVEHDALRSSSDSETLLVHKLRSVGLLCTFTCMHTHLHMPTHSNTHSFTHSLPHSLPRSLVQVRTGALRSKP